MRKALIVATLAGGLGAGPAAAVGGGDLLIRNARLIDATGAAPREGVSILVHRGRIAALGPDLEAGGARVLDVSGNTVLPGLIDAHVHLRTVPGSTYRGDAPALRRALRHAHLRGYLACGVTTVLDTAIDVEGALEVRSWLAAGHPGPEFLTLGPPVPAPGGYMSASFPASVAAAPEDLPAAFDAGARAGAIGVKVPIERGFGPRPSWPIHPPEMRRAIAEEAARRGLPVYVHASSEEEQAIGLEMGAHALAHLNFGGAEPSDAFVERIARQGTYVVTTFSIIDAELTRWHPERLGDPQVVRAVPAIELATARDPAAGVFLARAEVAMVLPGLPSLAQRALAWVLVREEPLVRVLAANLRAARRLHDAGVRVVLGSDAANWDTIPYQFHGASTLRELELLAEAGLAPLEIVAAATQLPAQMLGVAGDRGTVEVGKRADLLVLHADPLRDPRAFRTVAWTIKDGVARTAEEWMAAE